MEKDVAKRLDNFVCENILDRTRSFIKKLIDEEKILVNNSAVKAGYSLKLGDVVNVSLDDLSDEIKPENIPLDIVYEDEDLLVINKQKGLITHPTESIKQGTLVNALLYLKIPLSDVGGKSRLGIVHRLDKDTTGLILVAKNNAAHEHLSHQIKNRLCKRYYLGVVDGVVKNGEGEIKTQMGRDKKNRTKMAVTTDKSDRFAHTKFKVLKTFAQHSLLEYELITGRTHQIRVHSAHINHAILGDSTYNSKKSKIKISSQLLHAYKIHFYKPKTNELLELEVGLPPEFNRVLNIISQY